MEKRRMGREGLNIERGKGSGGVLSRCYFFNIGDGKDMVIV